MASSTFPPLSQCIPNDHSLPEAQFKKITTTTTLSRTRANLLLIFVVLSQLVQQIAFGAGINSGPILALRLGTPAALGSWIAAAYPLTAGTLVLVGGPLGAVYGHKRVFALGAAWWVF
jgi:MFS family permease